VHASTDWQIVEYDDRVTLLAQKNSRYSQLVDKLQASANAPGSSVLDSPTDYQYRNNATPAVDDSD
jgi:hypothetical protein